jgi:hypothetical protein
MRILATNLTAAGMLVCTASYRGGMGEVSPKNLTKEDYRPLCVAAGENAP